MLLPVPVSCCRCSRQTRRRSRRSTPTPAARRVLLGGVAVAGCGFRRIHVHIAACVNFNVLPLMSVPFNVVSFLVLIETLLALMWLMFSAVEVEVECDLDELPPMVTEPPARSLSSRLEASPSTSAAVVPALAVWPDPGAFFQSGYRLYQRYLQGCCGLHP